MNGQKTQDQRFMDMLVALVMDTPDAQLDELLRAAGFDPTDLATRGTGVISRALRAIEQVRSASQH